MSFTLAIKLAVENGQFKAALSQARAALGDFTKAPTRDLSTLRQNLRSVRDEISSWRNAFLTAAAAIGTFRAAGSLIRDALDLQSVRVGLETVTGSAEAAAREFAFVADLSDRLGTSLQTSATGFLKLAASAKGTVLEGEGVRRIFTGLSTAATALQLSSEQLDGSLLAVSQILSKGKVTAEDLRGQLGERLYGAMLLAAKATGTTTQEFEKLVASGTLRAEPFLLRFSEILQNDFAGGAEKASAGARAAFNRLENAILQLKENLATSGVLDGLVDVATELRETLSDPKVISGVKTLGEQLGNLLTLVARHGDKLIEVMGAIAGGFAGLSIGSRFGPLGAAVGLLAGAGLGGIAGQSLLPGEKEQRTAEQVRKELLATASAYTELATVVKTRFNEIDISKANADLTGLSERAKALAKELADLENRPFSEGPTKALDAGSLLGLDPDAANEAAEKAAKEAKKARDKELADWLEHLDENARAFEDAQRLKTDLNAEYLEAQGKETEAALARIQAQYDQLTNEISGDLARDADGLDVAKRVFNAARAKVLADGIKAQAEKLIADLRDRISFRDQRSEFVAPAERDRLQAENAADVARTLEALKGLEQSPASQGLTAFFENARNSLTSFADEISRATEGPIKQLFREWQDGARSMQEAAASWIDSTVNGITELVTGGKANFRDLADSIIKDIIRIQIRAAIAGLVGSIFPGFGGGSPFSASGTYTDYSKAGTGGGSLNFAGLNAASRSVAGNFSPASFGFSSGLPAAAKYAASQVQAAPAAQSAKRSGPDVQIINTTGAPASSKVVKGPDGNDLVRVFIGEVAADIASGGSVHKALNSTFGLNRRPGSGRG